MIDETAKTGNAIDMYNMAQHYRKLGNNVEMIKYYKMAVGVNYLYAILDLAEYYKKNNNYDEMEKYYKNAIENHNDVDTIHALINYYREYGRHNDSEKYTALIATSFNTYYLYRCNYNMDYYFSQRHNSQKAYKEMLAYYGALLDQGHTFILEKYGDYYKLIGEIDNMKIYYLKAIHNKHYTAISSLADYYVTRELNADGLDIFMKLQYDIKYDAERTDTPYEHMKNRNKQMKKLIQEYILKFLEDSTLFDKFFNDHKQIDSIKAKDEYIELLEIMPEGPKYAEAKERFNKNAAVLKCVDSGKMDEGLDED